MQPTIRSAKRKSKPGKLSARKRDASAAKRGLAKLGKPPAAALRSGLKSAGLGADPGELGHDRVWRDPDDLQPALENELVYRPVDMDDPEIRLLANSIRERGLLEPIVITQDDCIVSGHRRQSACLLAGLKRVPCVVVPYKRCDDHDRFMRELREYNRQRTKSRAEAFREEMISIAPVAAHAALVAHRRSEAAVSVEALVGGESRQRSEISAAKKPFLNAIKKILEDLREFLPLSDRKIHYELLNAPPLKHASKPDSQYGNDKQSYKALVELLTRARLAGEISMSAIADETRRTDIPYMHTDIRAFIRREQRSFLWGYRRNLQQSQPNHIEIIVEKNTVAPVIRPIARDFCIPLITTRGYCSLPPRGEIAERFNDSGKDQLVLLVLSDFDADGEEIAKSFTRSLRDDFFIDDIHAIKVALTADQVREYKLPPNMTAKESSSNYAKFVDEFGENVFELEALAPADLQKITRAAIESVIDRDAYAAEIEAEKKDAQFIVGVRASVQDAMRDIASDLDDEAEE